MTATDESPYEVAAQQLMEVLTVLYDDDPGMRVLAVPGQIIPDDWCWSGCAAAYVRLDTSYTAVKFPTPDIIPDPSSGLVARYHVGLHRCVSGMDDSGNAPPPDEQTADALAIMRDAWRIRCALKAWAKTYHGKGGFLLGTWTPAGPLGNCAGGFWPVTIRL